jgi:hypothetical protein
MILALARAREVFLVSSGVAALHRLVQTRLRFDPRTRD